MISRPSPLLVAAVAVLSSFGGTAAHAQILTSIPTPTPAPQVVAPPTVAPAPAPQEAPVVTPTPAPVPSTTEPTEKKRRRRFVIGPEAGVFWPSAAKTRNRFDNAEYSFGLGFTPIRRVHPRGRIGIDAKLYYLKKNDNRAIFAPLGLEFARGFGRTPGFTPFLGASVNVVPANLKIPFDGVDAKLKVGYGGSLFGGAVFKRRAYLEARYQGVSKMLGFNLSGFSLSAGMRF